MNKLRSLVKVIKGVKTQDGAGVNLTRIIAGPDLNMLDPFLLLDEFGYPPVDKDEVYQEIFTQAENYKKYS